MSTDPTVDVSDLIAAELRQALKPALADALAPLLAEHAGRAGLVGSDAAVVADVHRRLCIDVDDPWPDLHRRLGAGKHVRDRVVEAVVTQLSPRLEGGPSHLRDVLERSVKDATAGAEALARQHDCARFKGQLCLAAWRPVVSAYAKGLSNIATGKLAGKNFTDRPNLAQAARDGLVIYAAAVRFDEPALIGLLAANPPIPPVTYFTVARKDARDDAPKERELPAGPEDGATTDETDGGDGPDEGPTEPHRVDAFTPPGQRGRDETPAVYLDRIDAYIADYIARVARVELEGRSERPDLILDCVTDVGSVDEDAVRQAVHQLGLDPGEQINSRVRRAYSALQRPLTAAGLVCGTLLEDDAKDPRHGTRHVLPCGSPVDPATLGLPPRPSAVLIAELRGADLPAVAESVDCSWPAEDGDWTEVRELFADLNQARIALRAACSASHSLCIYEGGLVGLPDELPKHLQRYEKMGKAPKEPRPDPDPQAAQQIGRVIAHVPGATMLEAKRRWPRRFHPDRSRPLPQPLHKKHRGVWWYFPLGGVAIGGPERHRDEGSVRV